MLVVENFGDATNAIDELIIGSSILQSFTASNPMLTSFSINFATYKKKWIDSTIIVELIDSDNKQLYIQKLSGYNFTDNSFLTFNCKLKLVVGDKYFIRITAPNGIRGTSVTCRWGLKKHLSEVLFLNGNVKRGELYSILNFDNLLTDKDIERRNKIIPGLISVIIPCYNSSKFIANTLKSISAQLYNNIEIIVVDDGSSDVKDNIEV